MSKEERGSTPEAIAPVAEARKSLFDRVAGYLDAADWNYQGVPEKGYMDLRANVRDGNVRVVLDTWESEDWQRLIAYAIYPVRVPESRRPAVLDAINRINFRIAYGSFEMDGGEGELRIRTVVEAERDLPEPMMERALHASLSTAGRYFAPLMAVIFGNANPATVLDLESRADGATVQ